MNKKKAKIVAALGAATLTSGLIVAVTAQSCADNSSVNPNGNETDTTNFSNEEQILYQLNWIQENIVDGRIDREVTVFDSLDETRFYLIYDLNNALKNFVLDNLDPIASAIGYNELEFSRISFDSITNENITDNQDGTYSVTLTSVQSRWSLPQGGNDLFQQRASGSVTVLISQNDNRLAIEPQGAFSDIQIPVSSTSIFFYYIALAEIAEFNLANGVGLESDGYSAIIIAEYRILQSTFAGVGEFKITEMSFDVPTTDFEATQASFDAEEDLYTVVPLNFTARYRYVAESGTVTTGSISPSGGDFRLTIFWSRGSGFTNFSGTPTDNFNNTGFFGLQLTPD